MSKANPPPLFSGYPNATKVWPAKSGNIARVDAELDGVIYRDLELKETGVDGVYFVTKPGTEGKAHYLVYD